MAAFELRRGETAEKVETTIDTVETAASECLDPKRLREECIIALKVYDSCRN